MSKPTAETTAAPSPRGGPYGPGRSARAYAQHDGERRRYLVTAPRRGGGLSTEAVEATSALDAWHRWALSRPSTHWIHRCAFCAGRPDGGAYVIDVAFDEDVLTIRITPEKAGGTQTPTDRPVGAEDGPNG